MPNHRNVYISLATCMSKTGKFQYRYFLKISLSPSRENSRSVMFLNILKRKMYIPTNVGSHNFCPAQTYCDVPGIAKSCKSGRYVHKHFSFLVLSNTTGDTSFHSRTGLTSVPKFSTLKSLRSNSHDAICDMKDGRSEGTTRPV